TGNVIKFKYAIARDYDVAGAVQIVSLPDYADATSDSVLKVKPWDGASGGVFAIKAGTLTLSDSIDLRGKGFRGAQLDNGTDCWNSIGGFTDYSGTSNLAAARKGEGIATPPTLWGRGKAA